MRNKNKINKTWTQLQTPRGKDDSNISFMYHREQIVHQQSYRLSGSNENVDIKFIDMLKNPLQ
jgi:hypothetical protein